MDDEVGRLAERQHGVVHHAQLVDAGVTPSSIRHRLETGAWQAVAQGVYRLRGTPDTWQQRLIAVTFAAGPVAAASHRSAAALLAIPGFRRSVVEVTTPRPRRHRHPDVLMHRSRVLPAEHLTVVEGIVTTRVGRTLVDLAAVLNPRRLERAVDNCLADRAVTLEALRHVTAQLAKRGRTGIAVMRAILDERGEGYVAPASELEARFLSVLRSWGLPEPVRQADVGGSDWIGRVDFSYPDAGLLIELDGRRHHSAALDLESDRVRDNRLMAEGWRVMRVTWAQLDDAPDRAVALIRRALKPAAA